MTPNVLNLASVNAVLMHGTSRVDPINVSRWHRFSFHIAHAPRTRYQTAIAIQSRELHNVIRALRGPHKEIVSVITARSRRREKKRLGYDSARAAATDKMASGHAPNGRTDACSCCNAARTI